MASLKIFACSNEVVAVKVKEDLTQSGIPDSKIKIRRGFDKISISEKFPQELIWDGGKDSLIIEVEN